MATAQQHIAADVATKSALSAEGAVHPAALKKTSETESSSPRQLALGLLFGVVFGYLLQKGGVAKYHILMGVLLLEDLTVIKVMLSAILVGMVGVFLLKGFGLVKLHLKPTRYAANCIGGLLFGVGFGLLGYCPGTGAAAVGQGNFDALGGIAGLLAGSYLYAEFSAGLGRTLFKWGDRGKVMLPEVLRVSPALFVPLFAVVLLGILIWLEIARIP